MGYRAPYTFFDIEAGFTPNVLQRKVCLIGCVGVRKVYNWISVGVKYYPLGEKIIAPYIGTEYALGLGPGVLFAENGSETYSVGPNYYLSTFIGCKYIVLSDDNNRPLWLKLQVGYFYLLNYPHVQSVSGTTVQYDNIVGNISSRPYFCIGFEGSFGRRD